MATGTSEIAIGGGGVVGLSIALGLLKAGRQVTVLDGSDGDFRASQGNFGLVWVQGKCAELTRDAVAAWPRFAAMLGDLTGIDLALDQSGGFEFFTDPAQLADFASALDRQQAHLGNRFGHEIINGDDLRQMHPKIGPGASDAVSSPISSTPFTAKISCPIKWDAVNCQSKGGTT